MEKESKYSEEFNALSLREERRRTGRYVAVALAICITLLGLYQAMVQHTPVVAGLFAPAIIMFLYVFWVLYTASKTQRGHALADEENGLQDAENNERIEDYLDQCDCALKQVTVNPISAETPTTSHHKDINILPKEDNILADKSGRNKLNRTYSIA